MNPYSSHPASPVALVCSVWLHKALIIQMTKREVLGRYKGSIVGLGWSVFNPLFMLAVYTFVFSVVFKARWGVGGEEGKALFAIVLFAGLLTHALLAEVLNRAPALILSNVNYVKKVVFPLEILPIITLGAALFHSLVSIAVLLSVFILVNGFLHWTVLLIPLVLFPLALMILGVSWILASLGVYIRDLGQMIGIITTVMLFLAPVFYPLSAVPEKYHIFIMANPLTFIIEQVRQVLVFGQLPAWGGLAIYAAISLLVAWIGYWWFQKTRKGFADVL